MHQFAASFGLATICLLVSECMQWRYCLPSSEHGRRCWSFFMPAVHATGSLPIVPQEATRRKRVGDVVRKERPVPCQSTASEAGSFLRSVSPGSSLPLSPPAPACSSVLDDTILLHFGCQLQAGIVLHTGQCPLPRHSGRRLRIAASANLVPSHKQAHGAATGGGTCCTQARTAAHD